MGEEREGGREGGSEGGREGKRTKNQSWDIKGSFHIIPHVVHPIFEPLLHTAYRNH